MKTKILLIGLLFWLTVNAKGQIILEHTYDSAGVYSSYASRSQLYVVKLEVDSDKYVHIDRFNKLVRFYNMNHTFWKAISFANATDLDTVWNNQSILYISEHLFDLDNEIEFLYVDVGSSGSTCVTQVINENGSVLFTATNQIPDVKVNAPQSQLPIYNTSAGTKMILSGAHFIDINAYVYSLAGTLTAGIISNSNTDIDNLMTSLPFPNPAMTSTKINYTFPKGVSKGEIVFYDTQGKEVKRFNVDNTFDSILISTEDLRSGTYYYNLQTARGISDAKKLITVR
ncbi:MAG: T9SS type A sorting domain-containing protein [Bacteroidia bacterium]